jgi:hypothetical protein
MMRLVSPDLFDLPGAVAGCSGIQPRIGGAIPGKATNVLAGAQPSAPRGSIIAL